MATIADCRLRGDADCETAARAEGGALAALLTRAANESAERCTETTADGLGYLGIEDVQVRIPEACSDFGDELVALGLANPVRADVLRCQKTVVRTLGRLRDVVVRAFGPHCSVSLLAKGKCNRARRDTAVAHTRVRARQKIAARCKTDFDLLGLGQSGVTLADRVDGLLKTVVQRVRHFSQRVYPPNDLGPTADFGPFKVGVRTLELADPARTDVSGMEPRPVTVEVYYPSTADAVAGVAEDVVKVLGIDIVATPAFRDVARAPGSFPLILFSHGNNGIRFQSFFFAAHLASHGFVVVCPDHHGNTFVDSLLGIVDPQSVANRPRDLSFLIDQFLAFNTETGNFFRGALDPARIGVSGHSFGGYTTFAIAGGETPVGTFTDTRVKAIFPQAPFTSIFDDDFFAAITVPTLIVGGSIDETTPFPDEQQRPFDLLPAGATVVGLAEITDAGHFTFSDFCEVPRGLLTFLGGFDEACTPAHLPWRHAHDRVNFLGLNFFDAVLNGDADALARLAPANLAEVEDLVYQSK